MVQIRAVFDGKQVILPPHVRGATGVEVVVMFPDGALTADSHRPQPSVWDVIGLHTSAQTVDEMTRELRAERDAWDEDR